jgi:hypothetical protein
LFWLFYLPWRPHKPSVRSAHQRFSRTRRWPTPAQRKAAGDRAQPPLTDTADGFARPDTPSGVIKIEHGYPFFGSDGGSHSRQFWQGRWYGNNKYGSITRIHHPYPRQTRQSGSDAPVDVAINPNPDPAVNPFYASYDYMGGGPVYKEGWVGAGNLLMVYHAEIPISATLPLSSPRMASISAFSFPTGEPTAPLTGETRSPRFPWPVRPPPAA